MNEITKKAHEGKILTVQGKKYFLTKEKTPNCCKGCDLLSHTGCTKEVTNYCRQGFILKKFR